MNESKIEIRKTIIKIYQKGKTQEEISRLLDIPRSTISYWLVRYKKTKSLIDKPRSGRPSQLSKEEFSKLKETLLDSPPKRYGGESFGWTTKMAIDYIKENFGITYGMRQVQKLFHKAELSLITPRSQHNKSSYAARTVYRMEFKKNSKKNIWVAPSLILTKQDSD
jgi:transposase